jgi:hypothetical protein
MEIPMRRRIYYLLPDLANARTIMDELLLARIGEPHIHFLAKRGTPMDGLHEANILQKSDIVHGAQRGVLIGAALGCALGAFVTFYMVTDPKWQVATIFIASAFGAGFGGWTASLVGAAVPNSRLKQFSDEIENGKILLIVDVHEHVVEDVRALVRRIHPEAVDRGVEVNVPVFP